MFPLCVANFFGGVAAYAAAYGCHKASAPSALDRKPRGAEWMRRGAAYQNPVLIAPFWKMLVYIYI